MRLTDSETTSLTPLPFLLTIGAAACMLVSCSSPGEGQEEVGVEAQVTQGLTEGQNPRIQPGYKLSVSVTVLGEPEIDERSKRVSFQGAIKLPLLGIVPVVGMTTDELATVLTKRYAIYLNAPVVDVSFVMDDDPTAASPWGTITVLGRVKTPGRFNIPPTQNMTVSMAVQKAGGFNTSAKDTAIRITRTSKNGEKEKYEVNLRNTTAEDGASQDMLLRAGDVIYVPERIF